MSLGLRYQVVLSDPFFFDNHRVEECDFSVFLNFDCELEVWMEAFDFSQFLSDVVFVDGADDVFDITFKDFFELRQLDVRQGTRWLRAHS